MKLDLDKLLSDRPFRIPLNEATVENAPKTFEEWVAIHGEPEYIAEKKTNVSDLRIVVVDCEKQEEEEELDVEGIITEDKQGRKQLDYSKFLDVFTDLNPIVYNNGVFYTPHGAISQDILKQDIHFSLKDSGWTGRLDAPVKSLFDSLRYQCTVEKMVVDDKIIPLANGDLHIDGDTWEFRWNEYKHCPYRLAVKYTPVKKPSPLFDKWLNDVFVPEDIPTIQEILGYCLVPVTSSQEAFILVGDGGVGKSGFGTILQGLLGNAFLTMETQKLVTERFQIADVENKLVAYDDDLGSAALTETGLLKKLITADVSIKGERKYADPHEFKSYCRVVASANFMLSSLYDDSDGFYRRLHPIHVKPKDPNRKDIYRFYETILEQESEQILLWALDGLKRVIDNGWKISWSERSRNYLARAKSSAVHFGDFLNETCNFGSGNVSTAELKKIYKDWCKENGITPSSDRRFEKWLADNSEKLMIYSDKNIKRDGKKVRGYENISIKAEWKTLKISI